MPQQLKLVREAANSGNDGVDDSALWDDMVDNDADIHCKASSTTNSVERAGNTKVLYFRGMLVISVKPPKKEKSMATNS